MIASIIITTFNRANLLTQRALKSALAQDFEDYEVIVVDDAGTDQTEQMMRYYREQNANLHYFKLSVNRGLSHARNYGIMKAQGEYVVCLDDDNELLPDFLRETVGMMPQPDRGFDAVGVGRIVKYKDFEAYALPSPGRFCSIDWGWLITKRVFDSIQYDENCKANEDTDFGIRFSKMFSACVIDKPLAIAFDTDDPKQSSSFPSKRELDGMTYFLNKNLHEYKGYPDELRYLYRLAGRKFYRGGFKVKGLGYFWRSFRASPGLNSSAHLFFILFGWAIYDRFMTFTEKIAANRT